MSGFLLPRILTVSLLFFVPSIARPVSAQEETGWEDVAEINYVVAAGNARAATLGFANGLTRRWAVTQFELKFSGVRASSSTITHRVTSAGPPPVVVTDEVRALTAERYTVSSRVNRKLSEYFFWYAGADWRRNRFAGIRNRYTAAGGFGNTWVDQPGKRFRTEYAATFTRQEDLGDAPVRSFGGARLSWKLERTLTNNTTFRNELEFNQNLKDFKDYLADMTNSLQVAMSEKLATKLSLQWVFDSQPATAAASDPDGYLGPGEQALVELEKLDTVFTVSLVVNF